MSLHHTIAIMHGLMNHPTTRTWIVTPKIGDIKVQSESKEIYKLQSTVAYVALLSGFSFFDSKWLKKSTSFMPNAYVHASLINCLSTFRSKVSTLWTTVFDKRASFLGLYLLTCCIFTVRNNAILTCFYLFPTAVMSFLFAFYLIGWVDSWCFWDHLIQRCQFSCDCCFRLKTKNIAQFSFHLSCRKRWIAFFINWLPVYQITNEIWIYGVSWAITKFIRESQWPGAWHQVCSWSVFILL